MELLVAMCRRGQNLGESELLWNTSIGLICRIQARMREVLGCSRFENTGNDSWVRAQVWVGRREFVLIDAALRNIWWDYIRETGVLTRRKMAGGREKRGGLIVPAT